MTLFKQIALLISIFLLIILTTIMILNFNTASKSIQDGLYEDAKNTASSLSLSLATAGGDISIIETMINANFDSGNYQRISIIDMQEALLYERSSEIQEILVPAWFVSIVPIEAPVASANVSAGWNPIGILNVQSDPAHAYVQLYATLQNLIVSFVILALLALIILNVLLHIILQPLKAVQGQAEAIMKNEFIILDKIPLTTEFKQVVMGMNKMVQKVQGIFEQANEALKRNHDLLYTDNVTKLYNRKYLSLKFSQLLEVDAKHTKGAVLMIAFHGALEANKQIGRQKVDALFIHLANTLNKYALPFQDSIACRANGTEFILILPDCSEEKGLQIALDICNKSHKLFDQHELDITQCSLERCGISVGVTPYQTSQNMGEIFSRADYALSQAFLMDTTPAYLHANLEQLHVFGKEAWRTLLEEALEHERFDVAAWVVVDTKEKIVDHNVLTISFKDKEGEAYPYGKFIAPAIALSLTPLIYKNIVNKIFKDKNDEFTDGTYAIRLPLEYLSATTTFLHLSKLFEEYAHTLNFKLIIELPDSLVSKNSESMHAYMSLFKKYNIQVGIHQFTGESTDFNYLKELKPSFIKADATYFLDQTQDGMNALRIVTESVDVELVATGVRTQEELEKLTTMGINIVQGRVAEDLLED